MMEYVAIECQALKSVTDSVKKTIGLINQKYIVEQERVKDAWVENSELSNSLNLSLRTLQSYRERGVIGYSVIGRKIYYRRSEIVALLELYRINKK